LMPYLTLNDCTLYYETGGEGSPVVYVHGGFASLDTTLRDLTPYNWDWEHDFARRFHFITYDRRGCYRSSSPESGYDLVTQAQDLAGLLDSLNLPAVHLIGSSAGGPIATVFAAQWPRRVRSLVLVGTALDLFPAGEPGSETVRQQLALLERVGAEAAFEQRPPEVEVTFAELWDQREAEARGALAEYLERQRQWREKAQQLPKARRVHYYATELQSMGAYIEADIRAYAERVTVPTLVIHGTRDQLVLLAWAEELARAIPAAQLTVIEGGSHSLMIRDGAARRRVMDFMQRVDK
jgi:pimeloyl-ACP methyl ester carboxylesterase